MKIALKTADLKRALKDCARVVERMSRIPILSHVLIKCQATGVLLSVTDLEVSRQELIPYAEPLEPDTRDKLTDGICWSRVVSVSALAKLLPSTLARVKASPVVILTPSRSDDPETSADALYISVGGASTMIRTLPAEDFPTLPFPKSRLVGKRRPEPAVIPGQSFRRTINKIFSAISTEGSRFQMSGALFELTTGTGLPRSLENDGAQIADSDEVYGRKMAHGEYNLRMVATNGHVLNRAETGYRSGSSVYSSRNGGARQHVLCSGSSDLSLMVPRKAIDAMQKDAAFGPVKRRKKIGVFVSGKRKGEDKFQAVQSWADVHVTATEQHVMFETSRGVRIVARILEGDFPDYGRVIDTGTPELTIETTVEDLRVALDNVSHMTGDRARAIRLDLSGDLPVFSAANPDRGTAEATLNGKTTMSGRLKWNKRKKVSKKARATLSPHEIRCLEVIEAAPEPERVESFGVNPDYVAQAIAPFSADSEITILLTDSNSQFLIHSGEDESFRAVVMPIRL